MAGEHTCKRTAGSEGLRVSELKTCKQQSCGGESG